MGKLINCPRCGSPVDSDKISLHRCRAQRQIATSPTTREEFWKSQEDIVDKLLPLVKG